MHGNMYDIDAWRYRCIVCIDIYIHRYMHRYIYIDIYAYITHSST